MTVLLIGRGLLGARLHSTLRRRGEEVVTASVPWSDPEAAREALLAAASACARVDPRWALAWTAGAGVIGTPEDELDRELRLFEQFVDEIETAPDVAFLASSAGGLYAGAADPPYTEEHDPAPLAAYGRTKLAMEGAARRWTDRGTRLLVGRISNLYGPGQDLGKPQGLVSQLCLTQVTGQPLHVYASLDTLRDYLYVDDAAEMVADLLAVGRTMPAGTTLTKIVASGDSLSIGAILHVSARVFRRRPVVVQAASSRPGPQALDLRMRSTVLPELGRRAATPFPVGLRATARDILSQRQDGALVSHRRGA